MPNQHFGGNSVNHQSLFRASSCALALAAGTVLTGCSGVVKNLNSSQVNVPNIKIANPLGFSNKAANVSIGNPTNSLRAALKAHAAPAPNVFPFQKQTISLPNLQSAELDVSLQPTVTLAGSNLPTGFTLSTFSASVEVDDLSGPGTAVGAGTTVDDSLVLPTAGSASQLTLTTPVHFTQQAAGSSAYTADTPIQIQPLIVQDQATILHLTTIVSGGNTNKQAIVTLTATGTGLPNGTVAAITFGDTSLTVNANGS